MEIAFNKTFLKDLQLPRHKSVAKKLENVFNQIKKAKSISEISSLKKLKGFENHYRIRTGDYRIGLIIEDD